MSATYTAVLRDDRLEWDGPPPAVPPAGVRVQVTVMEATPPPSSGEKMAAVMEAFAASGGPTSFPDDLVEWQRSTRVDRLLPGRDE